MSAAIRLALPFLRSTTPWWIWPPMLMWLALVWLDWGLLPSDLGFGAVVGGGMLMAWSWMLGAHLRLCNTQKLTHLLPQFHYKGLLAVACILLSLAVLFAVMDALRPETLLALLTAAALGLGFGLGLPIWVLGVAWIALIFGATLTDQRFSLVWTSDWSPVIAAVLLMVGIGRFFWQARQRSAGTQAGRLLYSVATDAKTRGRQPYRLGRLFNHWPLAIAFTGMGLLQGIWTRWLTGPIDHPAHDDLRLMTANLLMFSCLGVLSMLNLLLLPKRLQMLRKLAMLPGWSRDRLFLHAELSSWRGGLTQILVLGLALLAIGVWCGDPDFRIVLNALAFLWIIVALGTYVALWLAREPSRIGRQLCMIIVLMPLILSASLVFLSPNLIYRISPATALAGLAIAALLSGWLRGRARAVWSSISFRRDA